MGLAEKNIQDQKNIKQSQELNMDVEAMLQEIETAERELEDAAYLSQDADELILHKEEAIDEFEAIPESYQQKIEEVNKQFETLTRFTSQDYDELKEEKILTAQQADALKQVVAKLTELEEAFKTTPLPTINNQIQRLEKLLTGNHEKIDRILELRAQEIESRANLLKEGWVQFYSERYDELMKLVAKIDQNPQVAQREEEFKEILKKRNEEKERKVMNEAITQTRENVVGITNKHKKVFDRIGEVLGNPTIYEELMATLKQDATEKERQGFEFFYNAARNALKGAIINLDDDYHQIRNLNEIIPWEDNKIGNSYAAMIDVCDEKHPAHVIMNKALKEEYQTEKIAKIKSDIERILAEKEVLKKLVGQRKNKVTGGPAGLYKAIKDRSSLLQAKKAGGVKAQPNKDSKSRR